jgi:hypothetical protein
MQASGQAEEAEHDYTESTRLKAASQPAVHTDCTHDGDDSRMFAT